MLQSVEELCCQAVSDRLEALVDGDLDPGAEVLVRRHLERCDDCRREWQRALDIRDALRAMPVFEPPRSVCAPLLAETEGSSSSGAGRVVATRRKLWLATVAAAAAVLIVALVPRHTTRPARYEASGSAVQAAAEAKFAVALVADVGRLGRQRLEQQLLESGSLATTVRGVSLPLRWLTRSEDAGFDSTADVRTKQPGGV